MDLTCSAGHSVPDYEAVPGEGCPMPVPDEVEVAGDVSTPTAWRPCGRPLSTDTVPDLLERLRALVGHQLLAMVAEDGSAIVIPITETNTASLAVQPLADTMPQGLGRELLAEPETSIRGLRFAGEVRGRRNRFFTATMLATFYKLAPSPRAPATVTCQNCHAHVMEPLADPPVADTNRCPLCGNHPDGP